MYPLNKFDVYSTGRFWKDHWTRYGNAVGEKKVEVERSKQAIARIWPDQSPRGSPPSLPPWASIINPNYIFQVFQLKSVAVASFPILNQYQILLQQPTPEYICSSLKSQQKKTTPINIYLHRITTEQILGQI